MTTENTVEKPKRALKLVGLVALCGAVVLGGVLLWRGRVWTRCPLSEYQIGKCYYYGLGVPPNPMRAAASFRVAAVRGDFRAQAALAILYIHGDGVAQNYATAALLLRAPAEQGLASAQNQLGMLYAEGKGVPQDFDAAADWLNRAAAQGCGAAQQNLKLLSALRPPFMPQVTLRNGKTYYAVTVQAVDLDSIIVRYRVPHGGLGVARFAFKDLSPQLQAKFGYTPKATPQIASSDQLASVSVRTL